MKNKSLLYTLVAIAAIAILTFFAIRTTGNHDHDEPIQSNTNQNAAPSVPQESANDIKEVALNQAQYQAADIKLGTFSAKNLSEVIATNGYTKLPPQNQADVSVYMSGTVRSILVTEGQAVKKGQLLAYIESPEYARLQQDYKTSQSNLTYLKLENERQRMLSDEGVSARKLYQKAKSDYDIELARFHSLQRQMNLMNIGTNASATTSAPILSPMSGYITEVNINIGTTVEAGKPLFNIVDNSKLHVDLLIYEKDLYKVQVGQSVHFVLTNQGNLEISGKIFSIGKAFENQTKSIAVHADITNKDNKLIPGMYVNALIDIGNKTVNALPVDAVVKADGREYIFILEEEEHSDKKDSAAATEYHFQRIEVKTGTSQLGFVQVTNLQPLEANAKIVLSGAYYLQSHLVKSDGGGGAHAH